MKSLRTSVLSVCVTLCSLCLYAQTEKVPLNEPNTNKPKLFAGLPETIQVSASKLSSLLGIETGAKTTMEIGTDFKFEGQVVSTATQANDNLQKALFSVPVIFPVHSSLFPVLLILKPVVLHIPAEFSVCSMATCMCCKTRTANTVL